MWRPVVENLGPTDVPVRTGMNGWRRSRPTVKHTATKDETSEVQAGRVRDQRRRGDRLVAWSG